MLTDFGIMGAGEAGMTGGLNLNLLSNLFGGKKTETPKISEQELLAQQNNKKNLLSNFGQGFENFTNIQLDFINKFNQAQRGKFLSVQKQLEQEKSDTSNTLLANLLMKGGDPETMRQEVMKIADWSKTPIGGDLVNKAMASIFKTQKPAVDNTRKEEDQLISDRAKLEDTTDETSTDILNNRIQNNPATKRYDQSAREELKNSIGDLNNTIGQANQYKGVDIPTVDIEGDEELPEKEIASENDEALAWAKENPNDPRAKEILEILKQRGVN